MGRFILETIFLTDLSNCNYFPIYLYEGRRTWSTD